MAFYESRGVKQASLHKFDYKGDPFDYIKNFKPKVIPQGTDLATYKQTKAPYVISGEMKAESNGTYKRSNATLLCRDLVFLDYDDIAMGDDEFIEHIAKALFGYAYVLYPTISHTRDKPRYRLVVKPSHKMNESSYKATVKDIADTIGLPFDLSSMTWAQLQGLPVTTGDPQDYQKIVSDGLPYPVAKEPTQAQRAVSSYTPKARTGKSITMRVIDTLLNGFGDEGGRNVAATKFIGLLFNKWVDCDLETAYELTKIANSVTSQPLPLAELDRTFESIARAEIRKRGLGIE
ncbi:primase alpha helix C-terminal domain-containing protein [Streptococcus sp. zg-JUN1979]|uniref:primase alpha helix C-terminal domain-containing protein n=1 Tax=Streptococcus sp. zg-JUN1979 TaxID=3391450 RepID=UPI0039A46D44